jgi:2OG-Fe(II) oxygenase superfamily
MPKRSKEPKSSQGVDGHSAATGGRGASTSGGRTSKRRFEGFPLHLLNDPQWTPSSPSPQIEELVPGRVLAVHNVLTPKECHDWVSYCESSGGLEYTQHPATQWVAHRECYRMQQADATILAGRLFQRTQQLGTLLSLIRREMILLNHNPHYEPVGCNPNLRVYKYTKGHSFGRHVDDSNLVVDNTTMGGGKTEWTVLVYLSECQGGATRFYTDDSTTKKKKCVPKSIAFDPKVGSMLVHLHGDHCLEHEADQVLGGVKYVLRTDLVFRDPRGNG